MNKPRTFFYLLCCFTVLTWGQAIAQDIQIRPCSFNGGRWVQTRYAREGNKFSLDWSDGPNMTYTLAMAHDETFHYLDSLGGRWDYKPLGTGEGFTLSNLKNGNKIVCDSKYGYRS